MNFCVPMALSWRSAALQLSLSASARALDPAQAADWLVAPPSAWPAPSFTQGADGSWTLANGLVSRTFATAPGFGTVDLQRLGAGGAAGASSSALRAVGPEGFLQLDNVTYALGSLMGRAGVFAGYANRSAAGFADANPAGWGLASFELGAPTTGGIPWTPGGRGSPVAAAWPPRGLTVVFHLAPPPGIPPAHAAVSVAIVYEIYAGAPLLSKWVVVNSSSAAAAGVTITGVTVENLRLLQPFGANAHGANLLYARPDIIYGAAASVSADPQSGADPGASEPVLTLGYTSGPNVVLSGGDARRLRHPLAHTRTRESGAGSEAEFVSFRALELLMDSAEPERWSLSTRRMPRLLAPWILENPMFFHSTSPVVGFEQQIDQLAAVGFEMFIYSFGSGFVLETADPTYLALVKAQVDYARSKGIEVGGYDLIVQDRGHGGYGGDVGPQWDCVNGDGSLGANACFASGWYDKLADLLFNFVNVTGLSMVELDGPYGGGPCESANHSHHDGAGDAVYRNAQRQGMLFAELRRAGVYINQPDNYFYEGGQRTAVGYVESQFSLPRWEDLTLTRGSIYDGTYVLSPSQSWTQVPLVDYEGGGDAAKFEPLSQHLNEYEIALAQNLGAGVAACYRGYEIFDTNETRALVKKWADVYHAHRRIINADIVHVRRPDGQSLDAFMHVDSQNELGEVAFALVFNPTLAEITQSVRLPLYLSGLSETAMVARDGGAPVEFALARDYSVTVSVTLAAQGVAYFVVTGGE